MKQKYNRFFVTAALVASLAPLSSCFKDLDRQPFYEDTPNNIYKDPANYKLVLARLYATFAVSGQRGPAGKPDIDGIDEGFSNYLRQYWKAQELTTDEAIIAWNDGNLKDYNKLTWTSSNEFVRAMYDRIFFEVALCNEFLRQTTDEKLSEYGVTNSADIKAFRAEARFLRALSYFHAMDMFGSVPFTTETSSVGKTPPLQTSRAELFNYVESELKAIDGDLIAPRAEYARADKATAWMLLAKVYLNAKVYTGQDRSADAATYAKKVIDAGYTLSPSYELMFLADNDKNDGRNEIIFPITFDGQHTKTYGGMTFLIHAAVGGNMNPAEFGIGGGWYGTRTKKNLVDLFPGGAGSDDRYLFFSNGQSKEINDIFSFTDGYTVTKYKNITSQGVPGFDDENFPDTDFPMFRLADAYLMYAEALLRSGGSEGTALEYVNKLRERSNASTLSSINLDGILDERARELYWEGHRRTDLIRFGKYTGSDYVWPFKGGVKEGTGVESFRVLFPIPSSDLTANPNLKQNAGY